MIGLDIMLEKAQNLKFSDIGDKMIGKLYDKLMSYDNDKLEFIAYTMAILNICMFCFGIFLMVLYAR